MPRFRAAGIFISSSSQIFSLTFIIRKVDQSRKIIQTRWFLLYSPLLIHLQSQSRRGRPTAVHLYTIPAGIIYIHAPSDGWMGNKTAIGRQTGTQFNRSLYSFETQKEIGILMAARIARRFSWLFLYRRETQHRDIVGRVVRARHE